jgi:hypothetical protein
MKARTYEIEFELPDRSEDGTEDIPLAKILFTASGYQPRRGATFYDPGQSEMFEDIEFVAAHSAHESQPLLPHEIQLCEDYINSDEGFWACKDVAISERRND